MNSDNTVTLFAGWTELGQGTPTAVRMIAAEELGLAMDQVTQVQVDTNVSLSAFTVGSTSTSTAMGATACAGGGRCTAVAPEHGLGAARRAGGEPVGLERRRLRRRQDGQVLRPRGGKLFNSTIAAAKGRRLTPGASSYKLIGTRVPRIDIPGSSPATTYIQNVRVPGMLHGRVVRPRGQAALGQGATVLSIDRSSVSHIPGVQVVQKGNFVGVVAPHEWDAIQAARS